jgi:hypothetical protein
MTIATERVVVVALLSIGGVKVASSWGAGVAVVMVTTFIVQVLRAKKKTKKNTVIIIISPR